MARPKHEHPTPAELEVLQVLWERGSATVREVMQALGERKRRAYTSVMSLMNVMCEKALLAREPQGKAFVYSPRVKRDLALREMVGDLLDRAFEGSASTLVARLLEKTSPEELDEIRRTIEAFDHGKGDR